MSHEDLIVRMRSMAQMVHDDLTTADEAADTIAALVAERDAEKDEVFRLQASHSALYATVQELRVERDAAVADAERYRYLRNRAPEVAMNTIGRLAGCWIFCDSELGDNLILLTGDEADAAIDAAMKQV